MKKILIISTGGTFNKIYDPIKGEFIIDVESEALKKIAKKWLCEFNIMNLIGKDSLDMNNHDRLELLATINQSEYHHIIIVHGTDTMDVTAEYLADADIEKCIVLTGAMVPYSVDPVEATANLCSAYGYINTLNKDGVFIAMNGVMGNYERIKKDRFKGKFTTL
ncbi:asparaginase domain-containing protein [Sulfurovum sp. XGS-02]|uniref:asparaginase domain-containing protein n=1 Tax=Sulfurovum sp. XGS-02 TaxID=2925411 RepID=UPI002060FEB0|nr:asparaginase domain-containing protein [Sulfurovum sp. XGS-02]UPT76748.1 asparaginase domain-containing protein [Sulfurovum sp. XGS-02]